jgi:PTH1 family peptidyl-tRNA hydrolase
MLLIVGLGNIGDNYKYTRHNIGFMIIDYIFQSHNFDDFKFNFKSQITQKNLFDEKIILCKPQTYMNLSGNAVSEIASFYKIPTENIIIFHDDLDLDFATMKYKSNSGAGGHNGITSIQNLLGTNLHKIKFGIGRPSNKMDVSNYVLSNFNKDEIIDISVILEKMSQNLNLLIKKDFNSFIAKSKL